MSEKVSLLEVRTELPADLMGFLSVLRAELTSRTVLKPGNNCPESVKPMGISLGLGYSGAEGLRCGKSLTCQFGTGK